MAVLNYSPPPEHPEPVASLPAWAVVLVGAVPLAGIFIVRGSSRLWIVIFQIVGVPAAFIFFGPVWFNLLFRNTPYANDGCIPFIAASAGALIASAWIALQARNRYHR